MIVCHQSAAVGSISRYQGTIHSDQMLVMADTSLVGEETPDSSPTVSPNLIIASRHTTSPVYQHRKPQPGSSVDSASNHVKRNDVSRKEIHAQSFELNEEVLDVLQESPFSDTSLSLCERGGKVTTTILDSPPVSADDCLLHEPTIDGSLDDIAALGTLIPSSSSIAVQLLHQKCKNEGKLRLKMFQGSYGSKGRGCVDLGDVAKMNANHNSLVKDQLLELKSFWASLSK